MGVRSSVLHHSERSGRWVLARQSRYDDGLAADDARGLCAGVREDGGRRKVRRVRRRLVGCRKPRARSLGPDRPNAAPDCAGSLAEGGGGWRDRVSQSIFDSFLEVTARVGVATSGLTKSLKGREVP